MTEPTARLLTHLRGSWSATPLRVRLVAATLVLVTAALAVAGLAAAATLRSYLVRRVDVQLQSFAGRFAGAQGGSDDAPPVGGVVDPDHDHRTPRLPSDFVTEVLTADGRVAYGPTSSFLGAGALPALPRLTAAQARAHDAPFTVPAVSGHAQWRVLAVPLGAGSGTLLVAVSLADVQSTVGRLELLELVIGAVTVVALGAVAYVVVRAALQPLRQVEQTAAAIAAGDLARRVPDRPRRTEVGRLGAAVNTMLEQIETAFRRQAASEAAARRSEERMRRFVADASHELRTPLTSIRGFAELYRLQHRADGPPEVARGMRRIEEEAARMGGLVDDLLLLARLDQERPLAQEQVDLLQLAGDAVLDAEVSAPQRRVSFELGAPDPPPIVVGDPDRLRQVLANLLSNALRYTPPDTPVEVHLRTRRGTGTGDPGRAVLAVVDHGPGLSGEEAAHVFERFYRADTARSRDEGGAGLGLAIVAALVARHGGTVRHEPTPEGGATFVVTLPLAARDDAALISR